MNFLAMSSTSSLDMELVTSTANTFSSSSPTGSISLDNFYNKIKILSKRERRWCKLTSIQSAELVSPACLWRILCLLSLSDMVRQRMTRSGPRTDLRSEWSTLIGRGISRLGSHWSRVMLAPALLCHKEPTRRVPKPLVGGFGCPVEFQSP